MKQKREGNCEATRHKFGNVSRENFCVYWKSWKTLLRVIIAQKKIRSGGLCSLNNCAHSIELKCGNVDCKRGSQIHASLNTLESNLSEYCALEMVVTRFLPAWNVRPRYTYYVSNTSVHRCKCPQNPTLIASDWRKRIYRSYVGFCTVYRINHKNMMETEIFFRNETQEKLRRSKD